MVMRYILAPFKWVRRMIRYDAIEDALNEYLRSEPELLEKFAEAIKSGEFEINSEFRRDLVDVFKENFPYFFEDK